MTKSTDRNERILAVAERLFVAAISHPASASKTPEHHAQRAINAAVAFQVIADKWRVSPSSFSEPKLTGDEHDTNP